MAAVDCHGGWDWGWDWERMADGKVWIELHGSF